MKSVEKVQVVEYKRKNGDNPFADWFDGLNHQAALKVDDAIVRMKEGNFSNVKSVGQGVSERKINFGPGYRIYFGRDGGKLIILLGGGTKKSQKRDVETARKLWLEYKSRAKEGGIQWH